MGRLFEMFFRAYTRHHFATFRGTATREEFWSFIFVHVLIGCSFNFAVFWLTVMGTSEGLENLETSAMMIEEGIAPKIQWEAIAIAGASVFVLIFLIISLIPAISLSVRRYHDAGVSGFVMGGLILCGMACAYACFSVFHDLWNADFGLEDVSDDALLRITLTIFVMQILGLVHTIVLALPAKIGNNRFA